MPAREGWGSLHHLAYLYAAVASVDGSVSNEEFGVLCEKLHRWDPEMEDRRLVRVVMGALSTLGTDTAANDTDQLHASIEALAVALDAEERGAVLDDLLSVAGADGVFAPGEGHLLLSIRQVWEAHPGSRPPRRDPKRGD